MFGLIFEVNTSSITLESSEENPSLMYIRDETNSLSIRCECQGNVVLSATDQSKSMIVARFNWVEVEDNFVDFFLLNPNDVEETDIVFGKLIFVEGAVTANVDFSVRTNNPLNIIQEIDTFFITLSDTVPNQNVRVLLGSGYQWQAH